MGVDFHSERNRWVFCSLAEERDDVDLGLSRFVGLGVEWDCPDRVEIEKF